MKQYAIHLCGIGRCSSWGLSWKRHWYDENKNCYRCGVNKKDV